MVLDYENLHLQLIINISRYLGHGIVNSEDLLAHTDTLSSNQTIDMFIDQLIGANYDSQVDGSGQMRSETLGLLMGYFQNQYDHWPELKSLKVLGQVFH